ncbi:hypothetical protein llap_5574 [Limosa lapponica baueri]|uniref:Uncharacterized protein n=1 Tax=Limosa lapponica baueri TaxID=1758121 RepID=A0A2I0UDJ5_LIMLA|nr:hypothetical protein llap_5574 [Limosa lapponica baueri]
MEWSYESVMNGWTGWCWVMDWEGQASAKLDSPSIAVRNLYDKHGFVMRRGYYIKSTFSAASRFLNHSFRDFSIKAYTGEEMIKKEVGSLLKLTASSGQSPSHGLEICRVENTESDWYEDDVFLCGGENVVVLVFLVRANPGKGFGHLGLKVVELKPVSVTPRAHLPVALLFGMQVSYTSGVSILHEGFALQSAVRSMSFTGAQEGTTSTLKPLCREKYKRDNKSCKAIIYVQADMLQKHDKEKKHVIYTEGNSAFQESREASAYASQSEDFASNLIL